MRIVGRTACLAMTVGLLLCFPPAKGAGQPAPDGVPERQYLPGEQLEYRIQSTNRKRGKTTRYDVTARVTVKRDDAGRLYEEWQWRLPAEAGARSRGELLQQLSLSSSDYLALPDLSRVPPGMIGPVTDLLTIYVDAWLASQQANLARPGASAVIGHGEPNSWADGQRILFGEDAIDFIIEIEEIDSSQGKAVLAVRHVPPAQAAIEMPATWMNPPVADVPNNWAQVVAIGNGRYLAAVGKETFDVNIELALRDGRILSAYMLNEIEVFERVCADAALIECSDGTRHTIVREVELQADRFRRALRVPRTDAAPAAASHSESP